MTIQEACKLLKVSETTLRNNFSRTQERNAKKGIFIKKVGKYPNTDYIVTYSDYWNSIPEISGYPKIEIGGKVPEDLTGQTFGRLTVLYRTNPPSSTANRTDAFWLCRCNCNNQNLVIMNTKHLKTNPVPSCGCYNKERASQEHTIDLTNQTFGELTVIERAKESDRDLNNNVICVKWKCQCACGNIVEVRGTSLRSGHTTSCGCVKSKGQRKIGELLFANNISFTTEATFQSCRFKETNHLAKFDFYLPDHNIIIEYDGEQHFLNENQSNNRFTKEKIQDIKIRDNYKTEWCKLNNYILIRIPYTHYQFLVIDDLLQDSKFKV